MKKITIKNFNEVFDHNCLRIGTVLADNYGNVWRTILDKTKEVKDFKTLNKAINYLKGKTND